MSRVHNFVLVVSTSDRETVEEHLNSILEADETTGGQVFGRMLGEGGSKNFEIGLYGMAGNYVPLDSILDRLLEAPWEDYEQVTLISKEQDDYQNTVYGIAEVNGNRDIVEYAAMRAGVPRPAVPATVAQPDGKGRKVRI
jgi:hypothetical protein